MKHRLRVYLPIILLLALSAWGCDSTTEEPGIVARVNGDPIYLSELEFKYDLLHMDGGGSIPSVEKIRKEYGSILTELIVQRLVAQELDAGGLAVTDEELKEAEDKVRADYPEDAFDQVLIEEYIDLNSWREQLRARLSRQKFFQQVLRSQIKINYEEAESYYRDHLSEFQVPDRLKLILFRGKTKDDVNGAVDAYLASRDSAVLKREWPRVETREIRILKDQLPPLWKNALKGVPAGGKSNIIPGKTGYECLVFQEELKARVLTPGQAYTLVEKILLEQKLRNAFEKWLEKKTAEATITVSAQLRKPEEEATETPEAESVDSLSELDSSDTAQSGAPLDDHGPEENATSAEASNKTVP